MFIGHFALGFAAKKLSPRTSLAVLLVAPLFVDLVFPVLLLAGIERARIEPGATAFFPVVLEHLPWSHSLLFTILWSVLFGAAVFAGTRDRRAGLVSGALVLSHWVLDLVTHEPDLALTPWTDTKLGLGLWNSVPGTLVTELVLYCAGVWVYYAATRPLDRAGKVGPLILAGFLLAAYLGNSFGPPPPSIELFAATILSSVVLIPIIWWLDRHRLPASEAARPT